MAAIHALIGSYLGPGLRPMVGLRRSLPTSAFADVGSEASMKAD
ncbi:hypothetical protein [Thermoflexus sp.]